MSAVAYAVRVALASGWRRRGSTLFAISAIALATLVLGALLLATTNVERLVAGWTNAAEFSVYLDDAATSEQRGAIEGMLDASGLVADRQYVSKIDAMARFRQAFTALAPLAAALDDNPFPASLEVLVRPEGRSTDAVSRLVANVATLPGVADVRYDQEWIARFTTGLTAVRRFGLVVALVMIAAAGVTVASVVRLGMHARAHEIEIMYLVGSPYAFIRGPFIAEGVLQGGIGALLALAVLWGAMTVAGAWWGGSLAALGFDGSIRFLPFTAYMMILLGGMLVGGLAGFAAARSAV